MKKQRKPRTKPQPWYYTRDYCTYFEDGIASECQRPWWRHCDGNVHKCLKLRLQWLMSLSEQQRKKELKKLEQWR